MKVTKSRFDQRDEGGDLWFLAFCCAGLSVLAGLGGYLFSHPTRFSMPACVMTIILFIIGSIILGPHRVAQLILSGASDFRKIVNILPEDPDDRYNRYDRDDDPDDSLRNSDYHLGFRLLAGAIIIGWLVGLWFVYRR